MDRVDGPILLSPRNQGFSLLAIQQPPLVLNVKPGDEVPGIALCNFLEYLWESKEQDKRNLQFIGCTEAAKERSESSGSTRAALFIITPTEVVVFTCGVTMYSYMLRHIYMLRGIDIE